jgi:hypothetical protein
MPGLKKDGIFPALLQQGQRIFVPYLFRVFRTSLATGYVPAIWRQVKAVFIPKPDMSSYSGPRDFTPISLAPFLLMSTNRLVDRFLEDKATKKSPCWYNSVKGRWMTFPPGILWDCSGSPDTQSYVEMKLPTTSQQRAVHQFVEPEPTLGISRQNIRQKIKRWIDNQQHMVMWRGLIIPHRRAWKLTLGPSPNAKTRLLFFNRSQFRAVTGLLTGHNTLRRHLYIMGPINSPSHMQVWSGTEEETAASVLCECEALTSFKHTYLGSFFLDPDDVRSLSLEAYRNRAPMMASD